MADLGHDGRYTRLRVHRGDRSRPGDARVVAPPVDSPLAKVRTGMGQREVQDLIGAPTDQKTYITGKAFIG